MNLFRFLPVCALLAMSTLSGLAGNIPQYSVTTDAPPYTPIEGGIPITWSYPSSATIGICPDGVLENSCTVQGFPIGFEFRFGGRWVNQFVISSSGQLYLGEDEVDYNDTAPFTVSMSPVSNGVEEVHVTYLVEGEAGDRKLTVQFADVTVAEEHSPKGRYNMQIRLFETDSHIEIAFEELQAPYGECQGFDVSMHGWDTEDSLVLTATDIADPPTVSPRNAASMLYPETYVRWNEITDGRDKRFHYRLSPESSKTAPAHAPEGLTVSQVGSSLDISVHRASDADATLVLWSKSPITDADVMPGDEIPSGGTVIYVGEATKFNYPGQHNEITYFRAWTVATPTLLKASEDEDGIIHISCRRAEDAA